MHYITFDLEGDLLALLLLVFTQIHTLTFKNAAHPFQHVEVKIKAFFYAHLKGLIQLNKLGKGLGGTTVKLDRTTGNAKGQGEKNHCSEEEGYARQETRGRL